MNVAMLIRDAATAPDWAGLRISLAAFGLPSATVAVGEGTVSITLPGDRFVEIVYVPAPIPGDEVQGWARRLVFWGGGDGSHASHLIAAARLPGTPLEQAQTLTRVLAAAADVDSAVFGLYWGAGPSLVQTETLLETLRDDPNDLPIPAWIGVVGAPTPDDEPAVLTLGIGAFGAPELLVRLPEGNEEDATDFALSIAAYVIRTGAKLRAGETVGLSDTQRLTLTEVPHPFGDERPVLYIAYP